MWARIDDHFDEHKKVKIAGARLGGPFATGRVLAVWLEGRLWSNRNDTQGFIPMSEVRLFRHDPEPLVVAAALAMPLTNEERATWNIRSRNCLWIEVAGGYRFHDDEHYRPKKSREELHQARAASGRRGGEASAAKRKQAPQQEPQQTTEQESKQFAVASAADSPVLLAANSNQKTHPVSRIPYPVSGDPNDGTAAPPRLANHEKKPEKEDLPVIGAIATRSRRELASLPQGDNYPVIAKLAGTLLEAGGWTVQGERFQITSEADLRMAVKDECGRLGIDRGRYPEVALDVVTRACASEWHKAQLGLRRRA